MCTDTIEVVHSEEAKTRAKPLDAAREVARHPDACLAQGGSRD